LLPSFVKIRRLRLANVKIRRLAVGECQNSPPADSEDFRAEPGVTFPLRFAALRMAKITSGGGLPCPGIHRPADLLAGPLLTGILHD